MCCGAGLRRVEKKDLKMSEIGFLKSKSVGPRGGI